MEADIWKIEGVDRREDCERIAAQCRADGRDGVVCVVLGRGADDAKVDHWLREAAPVDAYVGFAIGRSIWGDPLAGFIDGSLTREEAATQVADNYLRFIEVYATAESAAGRSSDPGCLGVEGDRLAAPFMRPRNHNLQRHGGRLFVALRRDVAEPCGQVAAGDLLRRPPQVVQRRGPLALSARGRASCAAGRPR